MRHWIRLPVSSGTTSRQAHADLPKDAPYEREMGRSGFFGPATHFHHRHPPTGWSDWQGELRPRAFDLNRAADHCRRPSPWACPPLLAGESCRLGWWICQAPMPRLARNADGDTLLFVHQGRGDCFCDFGHIHLGEGDFLVLPRGTMWRLTPQQPMSLLWVEATGDSLQLPERGLLGPQAQFDPAVLVVPQIDMAFLDQQDERPWQVEVKRHQSLSTIDYPFNPLDAVGWHGELFPVRLNWRDIRPVMSHRYHLPPSVHSLFVAERLVICCFVPRPLETDPGALKVPFYHNNDDYDEVLFYHRGKFFSRDNIHPGMVTFHPGGFTHGPHPKALTSSWRAPAAATDEVAVMVDCRDGLIPRPWSREVEDSDYVMSWQSKEAQ